MRFLLVAMALLGCKKEGAAPKPPDTDALWALTPANASGGIVISPKGVAMLENAYGTIRSTLETVGDFGMMKDGLAEITKPFGGPAITLADFGMSAQHGAALFLIQDGMLAVLPVVDRDKFLARVKGVKGDVDRIDTVSCKLVTGFYACATKEPLLATIGKGDLKKYLAEVKARGEIEIAGNADPVELAAVVQLSRGAMTLRGVATHVPTDVAELFTVTGTPKVTANTAGFALVDLRPILAPAEVPDAKLAAVVSSLDGMLTVVAPAGVDMMNIEQPVSDTTAAQAAIDKCSELPGGKLEGTTCTVTVADWAMTFDIWLDGKTLRAGHKTNAPTPKSIPMTPIGSELAKGPWSLLVWGRGSMFSNAPMAKGVDQLPPDVAALIRAWSMLSELGLGIRREGDRIAVLGTIRTIYSNPDDVLTKLLAITAADVAMHRAGASAEAIAKASPNAPFASDYAAGYAGLFAPTMVFGAGATIIIPVAMHLLGMAAGTPNSE